MSINYMQIMPVNNMYVYWFYLDMFILQTYVFVFQILLWIMIHFTTFGHFLQSLVVQNYPNTIIISVKYTTTPAIL